MYAYFAALILLCQISFDYNTYKTRIAPPIVLEIMWLGVHVCNMLLGWHSGSIEYLIFIIPPLMFGVGFRISYKNFFSFALFGKKSRRLHIGFAGELNYNWLYVLLFIDAVMLTIQILVNGSQIVNYGFQNLWQNVHTYNVNRVTQESAYITYSTPASYIFSGVCALCYFKDKSKKCLIIYISVLTIAFARAFLAGNRTSLFMVICINAFSILLYYMTHYTKRTAQQKSKKIYFISISASLLMFLYVATQKYSSFYEKSDIYNFIVKNLAGYYNLSSAAFIEWYKNGFQTLYGLNTFRFFYAILAKIGFNVEVVNTTSSINYIFYEGNWTNAFTVCSTYIQDFGLVFMAFMLMLFGWVHGLFYKRCFESSGQERYCSIVICGALYLGVLYQVLTDQYMNILSMWISFFIWVHVFTKLVFKKY